MMLAAIITFCWTFKLVELSWKWQPLYCNREYLIFANSVTINSVLLALCVMVETWL